MKVSIITVNLNNLEGLKATVSSVINQDYENIEYIIIDGDSNDGSKAFIEEHKDRFRYSVSEKDKGVYDAMNKGIKAATGDYLFFLNSGDTFYSNTILNKLRDSNPIEDIVYGNACIVYQNGTRKIKKHQQEINLLSSLTETITHQAMFFKKSLFVDVVYDINYKLISDWIFYFEQCILNNKTSKYINIVISNFVTAGLSSNSKLIQKERKDYLTNTFSENYYKLYKLMVTNHNKYSALKNHTMVKLLFNIKKALKF